MTKKQILEKWQLERGRAAGEASKLNANLGLKRGRVQRLKNGPPAALAQAKNEMRKLESELLQISARVVTIDQFLKDV